MIPEELAGRRIAITGSTGFLGTALVERLLRCAPDCELVLVVRPGRRGADRRVERDILRNDAFEKGDKSAVGRRAELYSQIQAALGLPSTCRADDRSRLPPRSFCSPPPRQLSRLSCPEAPGSPELS